MACLSSTVRAALLPVAALLGLLLAAPGANAAFSIAPTLLSPSQLIAGGHQDLQLRIALPDATKDAENIDIVLPPGLVGNPGAVTRCSVAQANTNSCPAASQVGTVTAIADAIAHNSPLFGSDLPIPDLDTPGIIYMMDPRGDEPARLLIRLTPQNELASITPITIESALRLNSPGNYGLRTEIRSMPRSTPLWYYGLFDGGYGSTASVHVKSMVMTLKGTPPVNPLGPFLTNPTSCDPVRFEASGVAYGTTKWVTGQSPQVQVTGCDNTPFTPSMDAPPTTVTADQPTGVSVTMRFPTPDSGTAQSTVKSATVVLPEGFALSASSATAGLDACTDGVFAAALATRPDCPSTSEVGSVEFVTPLIADPIIGKVYIGEPKPGVPLRLLIHAESGSIHLKLSSRAVTDPVSGQVTTIFDDIPPIPFTSFTMNFRGGDNAMIKAPSVCGDSEIVAGMEPASRPGTSVTLRRTVTTTGCGQAQFAPTLSTSISSPLAGADTGMTLTFSRTDADDRFDAMKVSLPPGLLGRLTAVDRCPLTVAQAAACSAASSVGSVSVLVGTGNTPKPIDGSVFLTEPEVGAVAGLAIVLPGQVGPLDLGNAVVLAKMTVRPDLGIDVTTAAMPTILGGVPLFVRSMTIRLDRPGFMFNASSCAEQAIASTLSSHAGRTVTASAPYAPLECGALQFAPAISAKVVGKLIKPGLDVTMAPRPGDASIASMAMTLPVGLGANPDAVYKNTCLKENFANGTCGANSIIGSATAVSPIIPDPLTGPVYLVQLPGQVLPGLAVSLHGLIDMPITIVNGTKGGRLTSTVRDIPDVPLTSFHMSLDQNALLQAESKDLCSGAKTLDAAFTGHNGASSQSAQRLALDCSKKNRTLAPVPKRARATGSLRRSGKGAAFKLKVRGKQITKVQITLPKSAVRVGKKGRVRGAVQLTSGKRLFSRSQITVKRQTLTVKVPASMRKKGVSTLNVDLAREALRRGKKLRRGSKVSVKVRVWHATGPKTTFTLKLKVR